MRSVWFKTRAIKHSGFIFFKIQPRGFLRRKSLKKYNLKSPFYYYHRRRRRESFNRKNKTVSNTAISVFYDFTFIRTERSYYIVQRSKVQIELKSTIYSLKNFVSKRFVVVATLYKVRKHIYNRFVIFHRFLFSIIEFIRCKDVWKFNDVFDQQTVKYFFY